MEILVSPNKPDKAELRRMEANLGCHKCPHCGETRDTFDPTHPKDGHLHGISRGIVDVRFVGGRFFKRNKYGIIKFYTPSHFEHRDIWNCFECGTEWASGPY